MRIQRLESSISRTPSSNSTTNNGNIQSYTYSGGGLSYTQSFSYDSLNRLSTATETNGGSTNWSQTNAYDQYGNRRIDYGGGSYNLAFSSSTNRITTSGFSYDSAGNLTNDTIHTYAFDANDKIKSVDSTAAYTYDGAGQRVRKLVGENTRFVYGIGSELIAEYDGSSGNLKKEYISGGITIEPTAVNSNGTQYSTGDQLGSPRVFTNSSGSVVIRHDYMPYGEELGATVGGRTTGMGFSGTGDNNRKKFTGYQRDTESGLDYAQARYYGNTQGRFTSPDPLSGSAIIADPQTFNRYQYCRNNPVNSTDPTGMAAMGVMQQPGGERANAAQGMIDEAHGIIQQDEAEWEERVTLAFMGIHENDSVTVIISSADSPSENEGEVLQPQSGSAANQQSQQVVNVEDDPIINKRLEEINKQAKSLQAGEKQIATTVVYIQGQTITLKNATIKGPESEGKVDSGYMKAVAVVVLDQKGNIIIDPEMTLNERVTPVSPDAKTLRERNRLGTGEEVDVNQDKRGV